MAIFVNNRRIDIQHYPDGTPMAKVDKNLSAVLQLAPDPMIVDIRYESVEDFIAGIGIAKLLRSTVTNHLSLRIPYLPGTRQDKTRYELGWTGLMQYPQKGVDVFPGATLFGSIVNSVSANIVQIWDPHSEASINYINNTLIYNEPPVPIPGQYDLIVGADRSAFGRARVIGLSKGVDWSHAVKERDLPTGKITRYCLSPDAPKIKGKTILVVDDICDGGSTFKLLFEELKNASEVDLYVTHGIFSGNAASNLHGYRNVFCTNSLAKYCKEDMLTTAEIIKWEGHLNEV